MIILNFEPQRTKIVQSVRISYVIFKVGIRPRTSTVKSTKVVIVKIVLIGRLTILKKNNSKTTYTNLNAEN